MIDAFIVQARVSDTTAALLPAPRRLQHLAMLEE
jgi:hypothetical protein